MAEKIYIGVDNGVTGAIGVVGVEKPLLLKTPVRKELSYTKEKKYISRIDIPALAELLSQFCTEDTKPFVLLERPMVNPKRFMASMSAVRALEATLAVLEVLGIPYEYMDSKAWQKAMLPAGLQGEELKKASSDIGTRLFPHLAEQIGRQKDADAVLMAEYSRRNNR